MKWYNPGHANLIESTDKDSHASTKTTEAAYLPWVRELQDARIAEIRKAQAGIKTGTGKVITMRRG